MSIQSAIIKSYSSASKAWYPTPSGDLTGTLTSTGKTIKGTGTLFTSQLSPGDYLLNADADEVEIIERIDSDTLLTLRAALTTPITGATCKRIKNDNIKAMQVVFTVANGAIRGASQATGGTWPFGVVWRMKKEGGIDPQLITPSGGGAACVTLEF